MCLFIKPKKINDCNTRKHITDDYTSIYKNLKLFVIYEINELKRGNKLRNNLCLLHLNACIIKSI